MNQKGLTLLALLLIAAMVLTACGGGAAPTEEPAPAPVEEESAPAEEEAAEEEMAEEPAEEMAEEMEAVTITMWHSFKDTNIEAITNTIILGAYCATDPAISLDSVCKALPDFFSEDKVELNVKAVELGYKYAREVS